MTGQEEEEQQVEGRWVQHLDCCALWLGPCDQRQHDANAACCFVAHKTSAAKGEVEALILYERHS